MKLTLYSSIIAIILFFSSAFSQDDQSVVAQVGNHKITYKEFKLRMDLSPYLPEYKNIAPDSIKFDFLYSWIAEKLWADEAERLGIENTDKFKFYFNPLEDLFVRDALFKKEVEQKVLLNADDINNAIMKSQIKLNTQMVMAIDSSSMFTFYKQIEEGQNFDSLISSNKELSSKDIDIQLGTLADEEIEDSLYSLKIDHFTKPIKSEVGWVLFRLKNKVLTPIDLTNKETFKKTEDLIKERRIRKRYEQYLKDLLSGITIKINPEAFNFVADMVWKYIKKHTSTEDKPNYYELTEKDFENILAVSPPSKLDQSLFSIEKKKITVESFLSQLAFDGFSSDKLDSVFILQKLNKKVKQFAENQLITNEAYAQQLNLNQQVRNDLSLWKEKYLSQFYFLTVLDSINISENDIYNFYLSELQNKINLQLVNVRILTLDNLDSIAVVLNQIKNGKDFGDILKSYGRTDSLVNIMGESNLRPLISLGEVGNLVANLKLNEVYGPIQRNKSYSLFQVIERRDPDDSVKVSFASVKNQLRERLRIKILTDKLNRNTALLAEQNNVKIYSNVVNGIKNVEIPMFVHRLMGFGGRIAGMPLLTPFSGWIKYTNKNTIFP